MEPWERAVCIRIGWVRKGWKFQRTMVTKEVGPGVYLSAPWPIDSWLRYVAVTVVEQPIKFQQGVVLKGGDEVYLSVVLSFEVESVLNYVLCADNAKLQLALAAEVFIRERASEVELDSLAAIGDLTQARERRSLGAKAKRWGIRLTDLEISQVVRPIFLRNIGDYTPNMPDLTD